MKRNIEFISSVHEGFREALHGRVRAAVERERDSGG